MLGQVVAPKGVNEIRPLELLALVALSGPLMMGASVHCQSENGNLIAGKGGSWQSAFKPNRPVVQVALEAFFAHIDSGLGAIDTTIGVNRPANPGGHSVLVTQR